MKSVNQPEQQNKKASSANDIEQLLADLKGRSNRDILGHEALRVLRTLWPSIFRVSSPRPLKVGIDKDIAETSLVPDNITKIALRCFTRLDQYLESTRAGRPRIGLDGKTHGKVRLDEAVNADMMLYARYCRKNPQRVFVGQLRLATEAERKVDAET
ncbi:ProQ/FinO family protein [Sansalvadorimonas sp. 2012CJ34-2]|uniref:ProQ/FinO family protein n=1 Tax=Parendozoicomonas callyspongiae TaxID=2942213 RepID=A0ABT0PL01_9GAMM|nr:ProQ/FINO family protein [Sansalvadorimonas sp. 2012CJ34-2]MCL6272065.1 ProQ/FinO family protein [Sansalvadorimonas sp. 2012CJ34-2]